MDVETSNETKSMTKAWLSAMRLRTLPLALASTLTGAFLVLNNGAIDGAVLVWTMLTTVFLQVNSNLANDYGDFAHGTDNQDRIGPTRALQSGALKPEAMKQAIQLFSLVSLLSGTVLLYLAPLGFIWKAVLFILGIAAIYASVRYTAGKNPYGYRGLGDVSVMTFFGLLGVIGSYWCQVGALSWDVLLPSLSIGAFSTGVLNVNNTRDRVADENYGKMTIAVRLGPQKARQYQTVLMIIGMGSMLVYALMNFSEWTDYLFLVSYPLFILNAYKVNVIKEDRALDPLLKQLALSTFLFSLLIGLGLAL